MLVLVRNVLMEQESNELQLKQSRFMINTI